MNQLCLASVTVRLSSGQLECAVRPWPLQSRCDRPLNLFPLPLSFCPIYFPPDRHSGQAFTEREHTVTVGFTLGSCLGSNKDTLSQRVRAEWSDETKVHLACFALCTRHILCGSFFHCYEKDPSILGMQLDHFPHHSLSLFLSWWKEVVHSHGFLTNRAASMLNVVRMAVCFLLSSAFVSFSRFASSHLSHFLLSSPSHFFISPVSPHPPCGIGFA